MYIKRSHLMPYYKNYLRLMLTIPQTQIISNTIFNFAGGMAKHASMLSPGIFHAPPSSATAQETTTAGYYSTAASLLLLLPVSEPGPADCAERLE